jgi:hypothetical protein
MKLSALLSCLLIGTALANRGGLAAKSKSKPKPKSNVAPSRLESRANTKLGSNNWSGALVHEDGVEYKSVSAEMVIPNITFQWGYNSTSDYEASVWVGFGGYNYYIGSNNYSSQYKGVFNTGFYYLFDPLGDYGVYPFYEWWPGNEQYWNISLEMGDHVRFTATQTSNSTGHVLFENLSRGVSASEELIAPEGSEVDLSMVEWIIQSFMADYPTTDFPDFGTMKWENMIAAKSDGTEAALADAYFIEANGQVNDTNTGYYLVSVDIEPPQCMNCKWLGYDY